MPMYEFACECCGQPFDKKLRMSQIGETQTCPHCTSQQTRRRFSSAVAVGGVSRSQTAVSAGPPPSNPFT